MSTREAHEGYIRRTIGPVLGGVKVRKLGADSLDALYTALKKCSRLCGRFSKVEHHTEGARLRPAVRTALARNYLVKQGQHIAADLQPPNFGSKRVPGADLPRMQGFAERYRVNRDTLTRAPAPAANWSGRPARGSPM